ncbi:DUF2273 domain-containing protein [Microbacterium sp. G2-8]|uniref:DUF2273 domain-containing protein n=1 Tax=Microbacterium sp. G2-8 TaxID=2842454 RepID=UPI001C894456|nr:DUF2273 domain-containing protein [Microbacterium sp. G2-8]
MTTTVMGAGVGAVLAVTWIVLGFWAVVVVALAMLVGGVVGRIMDGRVDVRALVDALRGRRTSS